MGLFANQAVALINLTVAASTSAGCDAEYRRALDEGLFPSNKKMAEALGVDLGIVGKALTLAGLPVEVIDAFKSPLKIQYRFAKPLKDALAKDS